MIVFLLFIYISSVYSPFYDKVGLPLHNIPSSGVLVKSIGANFMTGCPSCRQTHAWDAVSNSFKYNILVGTQPIQL